MFVFVWAISTSHRRSKCSIAAIDVAFDDEEDVQESERKDGSKPHAHLRHQTRRRVAQTTGARMSLGAWLLGAACAPIVLTWCTYLLHHAVLAWTCKEQDLKKKYEAKWALVTGSSSGIGKALAKRLAEQGIDVVLVSLDDPLLQETYDELVRQFPERSFRKVGVNLGQPGYMPHIQGATEDIDVQLVFNNAGYMLTGFFLQTPVEKQMENLECNAVCAMQITHHFVKKMKDKKMKGCVVFTSSAAASMPSPFTVLYAATKSFLSSFGASLAAEVKCYGIDVLVVHPSPVASRFYDKAHKLDALDFFKKFSVGPSELPDVIFGSIGRTVWRDIGPVAVLFRLLMKLVDYNFLATLTANTAHTMKDFKRHATA